MNGKTTLTIARNHRTVTLTHDYTRYQEFRRWTVSYNGQNYVHFWRFRAKHTAKRLLKDAERFYRVSPSTQPSVSREQYYRESESLWKAIRELQDGKADKRKPKVTK